MNRLFAILLLPIAVIAKDFTGPGLLQCDRAEVEATPCDTPDLGDIFECLSCFDLDDFIASLTSLFDSMNEEAEYWTYNLACDCVTLTNCPESCELLPDVEKTTFQGPGVLTCPSSEFTRAPCLPSGIDTEACLDPDSCNYDATSVSPKAGEDTYQVPLPCDCITAVCSVNCTLTSVTGNVNLFGGNGTQEFAGVGTISCPLEDYLQNPCYANEDECTELCEQDFDVSSQAQLGQIIEGIIASDPLNYTIPLGCECVKAKNCADSCVFLDGVLPEEEEPLVLVDFTGPGLLSCPVSSYFRHPCFPEFDDQNGACEIECGSLEINGNATEEYFNIPIPCECTVVKQCPEDCRLIPGTISEPENPFGLSKQEFSGTGTVRCSVLDTFFAPCDLDSSACDVNDDCAFTTVSDVLDLEFVMTMNCPCLKANCPSTCEFDDTVENFPEYNTDFTGPGVVKCPARDYFRKPCVPNLLDAGKCTVANKEECLKATAEFSLPRQLKNLDGSFELPLSCDCVSLNQCASTCILESDEEDNNDGTTDGTSSSTNGDTPTEPEGNNPTTGDDPTSNSFTGTENSTSASASLTLLVALGLMLTLAK